MDMLNILRNFDTVEKGGKPSVDSQGTNDMRTILESFQKVSESEQAVEECGGMEMAQPMPSQMPAEEDKVTMNVSINAKGIDAIDELIGLMGGNKETHIDMPMSHDAMHTDVQSHDDEGGDMGMRKLIALTADEEIEEDERYQASTSPDEEYSDHHKMTHDLSGGLNREKKQYAKAQDGDNAMAVEALKAELSKALREKMDPVGQEDDDINNDGKEDDQDEYLKKRRNAISKATNEAEDDDPCWDGYEMIGMKKKNGKEVPNCVPKK